MYGTELAWTHFAGARLGLVRHRPSQEIARHAHASACMHIVLRGLYVEHSREGTVVACPGDVVFKAPEVEHFNRFGPFGAESLRFELSDADIVLAAGFDPSRASGFERVLRLSRALRAGTRSRAVRQAWVSPQTELLIRLRRDFRRHVELGALAAELGIDRSHLTRQFTREFGCSPQAYVACRRTAWAAEQLALGGATLACIAAAAGFADQSHLTRSFKRAFGSTPARWSRDARW